MNEPSTSRWWLPGRDLPARHSSWADIFSRRARRNRTRRRPRIISVWQQKKEIRQRNSSWRSSSIPSRIRKMRRFRKKSGSYIKKVPTQAIRWRLIKWRRRIGTASSSPSCRNCSPAVSNLNRRSCIRKQTGIFRWRLPEGSRRPVTKPRTDVSGEMTGNW